MAIPKVFVSYSHDSQNHKKWVLDFATRLRNTGVDAIIDQWELKPGDDLPHFMEKHLADSNRVLMVCTNRYVEKANAGKGGVGYEKMIITADLIKSIDSNKVIPIIRQDGTRDVPTFLKSKLFLDFSRKDEFEFSFDELIRTLHNAPLFVKPPVGNSPFTPVKSSQQEKTGDAIKLLMAKIVADFEIGDDVSDARHIREKLSISRIMVDLLISKAMASGLITRNEYDPNYLEITEKGKLYAVEHKLVKS